eukprot:4143635-Amphidinium_carterae.1
MWKARGSHWHRGCNTSAWGHVQRREEEQVSLSHYRMFLSPGIRHGRQDAMLKPTTARRVIRTTPNTRAHTNTFFKFLLQQQKVRSATVERESFTGKNASRLLGAQPPRTQPEVPPQVALGRAPLPGAAQRAGPAAP